jgi:hypothetical protein
LLTLAAILAVLLAAAHSVLGERYILIRLFRREDIPKLFGSSQFTKDTLRFAWHLTSVAFCGLAAILFLFGQGDTHPSHVPQVIAVTFGVGGLVALVGSRGRHLSWVVFFLLAFLSWPAAR